jgi:uncharacterized membrane protein
MQNMPIISSQELMLVGPAIALIIFYHWYLYKNILKDPLTTAIGVTNHARQMWVKEVMQDKRDILAVQTIRNQLMASTFLASTAIFISIGVINAAFRPGVFTEISHELNWLGTKSEKLWMFKLMLLGLQFFFTFFNFTLAIRYYNHAGFMINTNAHNDPTVSEDAVTKALNHGALHYTIGMRGFYLSVPIALWLFGPIWMLAGSVVLVIVLYKLDREA